MEYIIDLIIIILIVGIPVGLLGLFIYFLITYNKTQQKKDH